MFIIILKPINNNIDEKHDLLIVNLMDFLIYLMIDQEHIKKTLKEFSFPRLSGTEFEQESFLKAQKKIEALNLIPYIQKFTFSSFYPRIYQKITLSFSFWILLVLYLNFELSFTLINIILIVVIFTPFLVISRKPEKIKIGKKRDSHNIHVKIPPKSNKELDNEPKGDNQNDHGNILILCHLDSKGQLLPIKFRGIFFRIWVFSMIIALIMIILRNTIFESFNFWIYIIGFVPLSINLIATIIICMNLTNNKSPGAIDNASGIACVLELLKHYSDLTARLNHYNLYFVFTGAEETGTMGIRHFYEKIKHFNTAKTIMLNFDSIGKNIDVFTSVKGALFFKNIKNLKISLKTKNKLIRTIRSDGYFLKEKGFRGFGFGDSTSYKYIHTKKDTIDKVDPNVIAKLLRYIIELFKNIDGNYEKFYDLGKNN